MALRENFDQKLHHLNEQLLELGNLAKEAFEKSIRALHDKDVESAIQVIDEDSYIDHLEEDINDLAILLIARESPVAIDLRRIIVALKISSELERVADYAVNISKSAIRVSDTSKHASIPSLQKMVDVASEMLSLSLKAYLDEDVVLAKKIADMDDEVDKLYGETIQKCLQMAADDKEIINTITQLTFVAKSVERIADYATNISEGVFYLVKGIRYNLNS
ncbi:phosphate signaling complex protein PhoU [Calidifontibacillus oryziterrae]|uniref:phosphate signaling complex protein PhoU n=1 Tax=Calidifontibacillus oryziterrae TaxID=1191699 RepID=UPI0002F91712|nr:phosphate signaling complex protein PhoU [Calidifontibacillus oryziterrae]